MAGSRVRRRGNLRRRGYSLASILLLTAVVAIFAAAVAAALRSRDRPDTSVVVTLAVGGSIVGGLVGVTIGLNQVRWIRGFFLGLFSGTISGAMAGVLLAIPDAFATMLVGAIVLVVFAVVVRYCSKPPPAPDE